MIFAFEFQLTIDKLTKPAAEAKKSVDAVTSSLRTFERATKRAEDTTAAAGPRMARETANSGRKIADEWQKMAARAEKEATRARMAQEREAVRVTRVKEREAARQLAIQERQQAASVRMAERAEKQRMAVLDREHKAGERMWTRIAFAATRAQDRAQAAAAKAAARAAEAAAHKPYFGGHKSIADLLRSRGLSKIEGMATGAADFAVGIPGMALGGIGGLAVGGIKMAAGAALDLVSYSADAAMNFAKMAISAQAMREQSIASFAAVYGSQGVAEKLFDQSVRIAKLTKFDTPEVVDVMNTLAANRFTAEQLPMLFAAYGDVAGARGSTKGAQYLRGLSSLNAAPSAYYGAFKQASAGGPGEGMALEVLADRLGIKKDSTLKKRIMGMMRSGEISSGAAINAILEATQRTYDKGENGTLNPLGTFTRSQGEGTWEGLISNIRNGLSDVLTMKLPDGHPMLRFKGLLREINSLFDDQTQRGQRFQTLMSKLVEDVFLVFDIDKDKTGQAMENLLSLAEALEVKVRSVAEWLRDNVSRPLAEGLSGDLGGSLATKLKSGFIDLGITLGKAVAVGMFDALGLSSKARAIESALKGENILAAPKPDKTPAQFQTDQYDAARNQTRASLGQAPITSGGEWDTGGWQIKGVGAEKTANAMGLPKFARGGYVNGPTLALVGEAGPEVITPAGRMGGISITGGVHLHLPPGSMTGYTEQDAQRLGTALMGWLAQQGA